MRLGEWVSGRTSERVSETFREVNFDLMLFMSSCL